MKFFELELNDEVVKLRLTSGDCITIEEKTKLPILKYIQQTSMTTITTLLMYMRRSEVPNYSMKDAGMLYDKLIDNGYTMEKIVYDVIYEALVVSGFLTKEQLEEVKNEMEEMKKQTKTALTQKQ